MDFEEGRSLQDEVLCPASTRFALQSVSQVLHSQLAHIGDNQIASPPCRLGWFARTTLSIQQAPLNNEGPSGDAAWPARPVRLPVKKVSSVRNKYWMRRDRRHHREEFAVLRLEEGVHGCSLIACNDLQQEKTVGNAR
jgi:hypothetical protein